MARITKIIPKTPASFENAVTLTGFGKFNFLIILATEGCLMCVIIETMSMSFIIPAAQCDLELSLTTKGILSSIAFFGVVTSSHLWGFLADTKGRKNVLMISLVVSALLSIICSIVPWDWLLIIIRYINGFFIGGASAVVYAYAGEFHDNNYRPKVVTWIAAFVAFGNIYLPALAWIILPENWSLEIPVINILFRPWRLLLISYGLPSLLTSLVLYFLPESPKYLLSQGKNKEALGVLQKMFALNTGRDKNDYVVSEIIWSEKKVENNKNSNIFKLMWLQTVPLLERPFLLKTILSGTLLFGIFASTSGLVMWYPEILNSVSLYTKETNNTSVSICGAVSREGINASITGNDEITILSCEDHVSTDVFLVSILIALAYGISYVIIGSVINMIGKKTLLLFILVISAACGIAGQLVHGYTLIQIFTGIFILGGCGIAIVTAIVIDIYPTNIRGMAVCMSLMFGRFGAVAGSNLIGPILYNYCDYLFYIIAAKQIVLIIITILLPDTTKHTKPETDSS